MRRSSSSLSRVGRAVWPGPPQGKAAKGGPSAEQIPVIVARDRSGATFDAVLPRLDATSLKEAVVKRVRPSTDFCRDGGKAITAFAKRAKLKIHVLPAPAPSGLDSFPGIWKSFTRWRTGLPQGAGEVRGRHSSGGFTRRY
jgi:hypothetical protein